MKNIQHGLAILIFALASQLFISQTAHAQNSGQQLTSGERIAMQAQRAAVEVEARQTIEALFSRLCPGRCELVEIKAVMESPRAVGAVTPGFDSPATSSYEITTKNLDITILLDSKLPRNFASNLPRMLQFRLNNLAPVVNVRPETLDFPEPQLHPMPPPMPAAPQNPQPRYSEPAPLPPVAAPAPAPETLEKPAPATEPDIQKTPAPSWLELLPWIALVLTLLIFSGLIIMILKRLDKKADFNAQNPEKTLDSGQKHQKMPDIEAFRADLKSSRPIQNRVLRDWLKESPENVAILIRLLGPDILADLRSDDSLKPELERVSQAISQNLGPVEPAEASRVIDEATSRLTAARVLHDTDSHTMDWDFLEGLPVANLRRILNTCGATEKAFIINQLPTGPRANYLESLSHAERRELLLGAGVGELLTRQQAIDLAARTRKAADELSHVGRESEDQASLVLDMLHALPLHEQEDLLRELDQRRPEVARSALARTCLESAIPHIPADIIANAMHRTGIETLANMLRGTREDIRQHLLQHAAPATRAALSSELSLQIPVGRTDFLQARATFTTALTEGLRRDGHDLAALNKNALSTPRQPQQPRATQPMHTNHNTPDEVAQ